MRLRIELFSITIPAAQIEFTINDNNGGNDFRGSQWMDNSLRRGYEALVRKILKYPNSPAVILVHYWSAGWSEAVSGSKKFWLTPEDEIDVIAKYYSLPVVSFRNTFYHAISSDMEGFRSSDILKDPTHPNVQGSQYLAYIVISYLESVLDSLPVSRGQPRIPPIPPPMLEGNDGVLATSCNRGEQLKQLIHQTHGWHWRGGEKSGWCANVPGAEMDLSVGTHVNDNTTITIGYLQSHKNMGTCEVRCLQGCKCSPTSINAFSDEQVSQQQLMQLPVTGTAAAENAECILSITVTNQTDSKGFNFEILAINVGEVDLQGQDFSFLTKQR